MMAHYAFLNDDNIVIAVIPGRNEDEVVDGVSDWEQFYGDLHGARCVRTSYNGNIRARFAGIGYTYDEQRDVFIAPQPFPSWTLNEATTEWEAPQPMPTDGGLYLWDEDTLSWLEVIEG